MKWTTALSENDEIEPALAEAVATTRDELGEDPDLVLVFLSSQHAPDYGHVPGILGSHLRGGVLIGCSAGAVIGGGQEVEQRAAVTVTAAVLPDVEIHPFHIEQDDLPDPDSSPRAWHEMLQVDSSQQPHFVLLVDPFSIRVDQLLEGLDYAYPTSNKVGGLASGAMRPGANALYLGNRVWGVGAVGVAVSGNIVLDTVVAQGCRPIGEPVRITSCRDNIVLELDQRRPLEFLQQTCASLSEQDRELVATSLHVGILSDELRDDFGPGDFLIRNIIGIDPKRGAMAIGDQVREGQTIQFHLRDAQTSADDLDNLLQRYTDGEEHHRAAGALLFSCLGRGSQLYGRADHDSDLFRQRVGAIPIGGFFCNGEIGPVGKSTYVHGFTSSFGIFRPL